MSSNVIRLSRPVIHPEVREIRKVIPMPNLFTIILNAYKKKQDELKQRKIKILTDAVYKYFLDLFQNQEFKKWESEIDIPDFLKRKQRERQAQEETSKAMMKVINDNRVDECFKAYKKYLKQQNRG